MKTACLRCYIFTTGCKVLSVTDKTNKVLRNCTPFKICAGQARKQSSTRTPARHWRHRTENQMSLNESAFENTMREQKGRTTESNSHVSLAHKWGYQLLLSVFL